ncbi:hypothetical protein SBOR_9123 [Sclerotinia borealis F-4128]|uniref:Uncharacterized protein n=1 Tax=Sclerotinia borealis (strain F-4128) TaxID=1432307 RepID=W9C455_SCLBF|nr:hypothetical protein SBOR_9123 [Sclerotinia borealis F-4128]
MLKTHHSSYDTFDEYLENALVAVRDNGAEEIEMEEDGDAIMTSIMTPVGQQRWIDGGAGVGSTRLRNLPSPPGEPAQPLQTRLVNQIFHLQQIRRTRVQMEGMVYGRCARRVELEGRSGENEWVYHVTGKERLRSPARNLVRTRENYTSSTVDQHERRMDT